MFICTVIRALMWLLDKIYSSFVCFLSTNRWVGTAVVRQQEATSPSTQPSLPQPMVLLLIHPHSHGHLHKTHHQLMHRANWLPRRNLTSKTVVNAPNSGWSAPTYGHLHKIHHPFMLIVNLVPKRNLASKVFLIWADHSKFITDGTIHHTPCDSQHPGLWYKLVSEKISWV